jgi:L-threonylcarbamoyladenylate synthase
MIYQAINNNIELASKLILDGEIIIYPTDTLYGMGVDATNSNAINSLNKLKKRVSPLSIIVSSYDMIKEYIDIKFSLYDDLKNYLPGPYTILLNDMNNILPHEVGQGTNKIGVRIPKANFIIQLVEKINKPVITTSVNYHNSTSMNNISEINKQFSDLSIFYDNINIDSIGSTIIDYSCYPKKIIRYGDVKI